MNYVLKGRIAMGGGSVALDETLTIQGMAADAKAAGDAIKEKANAEAVAKELDRIDRELMVIREGGSDSSGSYELAQAALETAQGAKVIAETTAVYVDQKLQTVVHTVNGVAPDEFGNVNVGLGDTETVIQQVVEQITNSEETIQSIVEALPEVTKIDFSQFEAGVLKETVDGQEITHNVTFDGSGRPTSVGSVAIVWGA